MNNNIRVRADDTAMCEMGALNDLDYSCFGMVNVHDFYL